MMRLWIQASIMTEESPSICSQLKLPCFANISLANRACASAMLLVLMGKGDIMLATTSPMEFLIHTPKPEGPGFPLDAPSKFNFQNPKAGGHQVFLWVEEEVEDLLIFHPTRMNKCFQFWKI